MGNKLTGYYGGNPDKNCGFEAVGLIVMIQRYIRWPENRERLSVQEATVLLKGWIGARQREAKKAETIAGGKHPLLCAMGPVLERTCDNLIVLNSCRPLRESIESFVKRERRRHNPDRLEKHQRWLHERRNKFIAGRSNVLDVRYHDLLKDPFQEIDRICSHLKLNPTNNQLARAMRWADPKKRHVNH